MAALLRCLQDVVIIIPLQLYLRGHAVEALRTMLGPSERHIGNRSCDASIAIFEWMDGDKPEMSNRRLDDEVDCLPLALVHPHGIAVRGQHFVGHAAHEPAFQTPLREHVDRDRGAVVPRVGIQRLPVGKPGIVRSLVAKQIRKEFQHADARELRRAGFRLLQVEPVSLRDDSRLPYPWWFSCWRAYGYLIAAERT